MKTFFAVAGVISVVLTIYLIWKWYFQEVGIVESKGIRVFQEGDRGLYYILVPGSNKKEITKADYEKYTFDASLIPSK